MGFLIIYTVKYVVFSKGALFLIYDVFICYRGEGKSGEFANWLYNELDKLEYLEVFLHLGL